MLYYIKEFKYKTSIIKCVFYLIILFYFILFYFILFIKLYIFDSFIKLLFHTYHINRFFKYYRKYIILRAVSNIYYLYTYLSVY